MNKKTISVVALDELAGASYEGEIKELFGKYADVRSFSVLGGSAAGKLEPADLFAISTDAYGTAEEVGRHVPIGSQTMAIEVSFKWRELRRLKELPAGTKALFVNMTETMAREAIAQLEQFGITHIKLIPFYPGAVLKESVDLAITPGEIRYIPEEITEYIDLGQRSCTSGMMIEIALRLGLEFLLETDAFKEYFQTIATSNYSFDQMFAKSIRLESQFHILMETLRDGVIGVNEKNEIFACNSCAEEITKMTEALVVGKHADAIFPFIPFMKCLQQKRGLSARVQKVNGINISIEVVPVLRQNECIGAFAILQKFNDVEIRQSELRRQLSRQGLQAKYVFEQVIGESAAIRRTKDILRRMAASESPVLLIGETGTGKELFAHAVHSASKRSKGPFVAINVAAVPENLLESELFGYEDGAFTGAKKGGRPGLFELAHTGTLFLDEVEGMSLALQVKLLRVLQEHEIMRVGGSRIIDIDVRIVAATNESLEKKVEEGSFRRDLYYRLNTLPIVIPPLSQREDDVFLLINAFMEELGGNFTLSDEIREFLRHYDWPGNIRELRNVVEYFIFTDKQLIGMEDLPPTILGRTSESHIRPVLHKASEAVIENSEDKNAKKDNTQPEIFPETASGYWFVLGMLYEASCRHVSIGREKIYQAAQEQYYPLSQQEIRHILKELSEKGYCKVGRGRGGSRLTALGRELWQNSKNLQDKPFNLTN